MPINKLLLGPLPFVLHVIVRLGIFPEMDTLNKIFTVILFIHYLMMVLAVAAVSEALTDDLKNTRVIVCRLLAFSSESIDIKTKKQLRGFYYVLVSRKPIITACNMFIFNFSYCYALLGVVVNYVIILHQSRSIDN